MQKHPGEAQVDGAGSRDPATEDDPARRGVVGDGVGKLHPPVRDAAVDDLDRGQDSADCGERIGGRHAWAGEVARHHEGDPGHDAWLEERLDGDLVAVLDEHVVDQHAEARLGDAKYLLSRLRGPPESEAPDRTSGLDPPPNVACLNRVSVGEGEVRLGLCDRVDRHAIDLSPPQSVGKLNDGGAVLDSHQRPVGRRAITPTRSSTTDSAVPTAFTAATTASPPSRWQAPVCP